MFKLFAKRNIVNQELNKRNNSLKKFKIYTLKFKRILILITSYDNSKFNILTQQIFFMHFRLD